MHPYKISRLRGGISFLTQSSPSGLVVIPDEGANLTDVASSVLGQTSPIPNHRIVLNTQHWVANPVLTRSLRASLQKLAEEKQTAIALKMRAEPWVYEFETAARVADQLEKGALTAMGMSMGMSPCLRKTYTQRLTYEQKLLLRQLLEFRHELHHPEFPNAAKGLDGMFIAHKILQEKQAVGILIGGLAEAVWNVKRTVEDLEKHKDVDVMVAQKKFQPEPFEGGVDWWVPHSAEIRILTDATDMTVNRQWWENHNDCVLRFALEYFSGLKPGLYIPDSDWVFNMRFQKAIASIDDRKIQVEGDDEDIELAFQRKLRRQGLQSRMMSHVRSRFGGYILDGKGHDLLHAKAYLGVESLELETQIAIHRYKNKITGK